MYTTAIKYCFWNIPFRNRVSLDQALIPKKNIQKTDTENIGTKTIKKWNPF